jgi:predicted acylesterase/phospholipase RssA
MNAEVATPEQDRIGLALSGGGFRASLFHLGVIRRLEELGIMEKVSIVSSVSGGSIIAAFYLCEMEKQLRESRLLGLNADRVALFEKIAGKFLKALDHNLRTRALIFTPRFHPVLFIKTVLLQAFRRGARAELIQAEYDKFFYFGDTMDQLPVERPEKVRETTSRSCMGPDEPFYGPRLLLNTTSLLTGERRSFTRDTSSGIEDLKTSDKNVLPLSRVVGASSGVPVLFPPTAILGDLLVDGGISDNQGIEGLLAPENHCNVILVSDASGQMQVKHTITPSAFSVYSRVNEIFQFQIRNKLLAQLLTWGKEKTNRRFAFIHLLVNLKDRQGMPARVSTSILPALGRIRTDLDQFSPVECEALMYHGYTLIDAQLRQYCCDYFSANFPKFGEKLTTPPLFSESVQKRILVRIQGTRREFRDPIRKDLEAGSESLYLLRCLKKYVWPTLIVLLCGVAFALVLIWCFFGPWSGVVNLVQSGLETILYDVVPKPIVAFLDNFLLFFGYTEGLLKTIQSIVHLLALIVVIGLAMYVASYPVYEAVRWTSMLLDRWRYRRITGRKGFSLHWTTDEESTASEKRIDRPSAEGGQF